MGVDAMNREAIRKGTRSHRLALHLLSINFNVQGVMETGRAQSKRSYVSYYREDVGNIYRRGDRLYRLCRGCLGTGIAPDVKEYVDSQDKHRACHGSGVQEIPR